MRVTRWSGFRASTLGLSLVVVAACGGDEAPKSGGFGEDVGGAGGTLGAAGSSGNTGKGGSAQAGASQTGGSAGTSAGGSAIGGAAGGTIAGNGPGGNGAGTAGSGGGGAGGAAGSGGNGTGGNGTGGDGLGGIGAGGGATGGNGGSGPLDFGGNAGAGGDAAPFGSCAGVADWGANVAESLSTDGDDWLAAITPDERTILFFVENAGTTKLMVADRAASTDPWGTPIDVASGPFARDRVALESNGLVLGVLAADRRSFVELRRTERGKAFGPSDIGTFHNIESVLPVGATLADPVIGEDDRTMFLSIVNGGSASTVRFALRFDVNALWGAPSTSSEKELEPLGNKRRQPTGLSADGRTLFFWDEPTGKLRRAVRPAGAIAAFDSFADVGFQQGAAPVTSCKRIYYSLKTGSSFDLFHADSP